jgi:hypothetical protein
MARHEQADIDRIRKKNSDVFVAVQAVELRDAPIADLASLDALVEIAKKYETVILELRDEAGTDFLLWDDGLAFRYRHGPRPEPAPPVKATRKPRPRPNGTVVIDKLRGGGAS